MTKNSKLKLILVSALAFLVGAFTLYSLPVESLVLAEEVPQSTVQTINSNYIDLMDEGVASGELTTYDYFDTTSPFPKGEQLVLYSFNCDPINIQTYTNAKMWSYLYYLGYIDDNDEVVRLTSSVGLYTSQYSNPPYMYYNFPAFNTSSIDQVVSYDDFTRFFNYIIPANLDYYNLYFDRVGGLSGIVYNFPVNLYNYFELLDLGYSAEYLSSYTWVNSPYIVQSNNITGIILEQYRLSEDLFNSINLEFVKLSDLLLYAFNQGYDNGYAEGENLGYDQGYNSGYQAGSDYSSLYLTYGSFANFDYENDLGGQVYTGNWWEENYPNYYYDVFGASVPRLNNGGISFDTINGIPASEYEYFSVGENGQIYPVTDSDEVSPFVNFDHYECTIFVETPLFYDASYYQFFGQVDKLYDISATLRLNDGSRRTYDSYINEFGYLYVDYGVGAPGYIESFTFKLGQYAPTSQKSWPDSVLPTLRIVDTSPRTNLSAYKQGYDYGYELGEQIGYADGKDEGFDLGYDKGKKEGYAEGVEVQGGLFQGLISSVIDVPLKTFFGIFDLEIFGINLSGFLLSLFSICMIIALIKIFI